MIPKPFIELLKIALICCIPLMKKSIRRIKLNAERVYHLPTHSAFASLFARQVLKHQIRMSLESIKAYLSPGAIEIDPKSIDDFRTKLQKSKDQGRGVVVITGHLGSWEQVAIASSHISGDIFYALAKPSKVKFVTALMEYLRGINRVEAIWTDKKTMLRSMIEVLKAGGFLGFVMDQKPDLRRGPEVSFLGIPTIFAAGPARLVVKLNPAVLAVYCIRTGPWRYKIYCDDLTSDLAYCKDEGKITQKMAQSIEEYIKIYPEQWVWNYKRW